MGDIGPIIYGMGINTNGNKYLLYYVKGLYLKCCIGLLVQIMLGVGKYHSYLAEFQFVCWHQNLSHFVSILFMLKESIIYLILDE